jgi:hypothetical protein
MCVHPELRRQIAIKHGKNVGLTRTARARVPCRSSHALVKQGLANNSSLLWQQQLLFLTQCAAKRSLSSRPRDHVLLLLRHNTREEAACVKSGCRSRNRFTAYEIAIFMNALV